MELKPDNDQACYDRGVVLDDLKRYKEALDSYNQALKLNPDKER
jgi:Flp pilus assembly protein TadD